MSFVRFRHLALVLAAGALGASGRGDTPPLPHGAMGLDNGCFVESVALADAYTEAYGSDSWVRVLRWGAEKDQETVTGHAVAVCDTNGALWCWDVNFGWKKLKTQEADREDVSQVSPEIVAKYPEIVPKYPTYFEPMAQDPDPSPPPESVSNPTSAAQEVAQCAAMLAKHRPVYAISFTHGDNDSPIASAALVFTYNGQICVYCPENGTVTTRAHGSVRNIRLVAEILHRVFPGTRDIKPLS